MQAPNKYAQQRILTKGSEIKPLIVIFHKSLTII